MCERPWGQRAAHPTRLPPCRCCVSPAGMAGGKGQNLPLPAFGSRVPSKRKTCLAPVGPLEESTPDRCKSARVTQNVLGNTTSHMPGILVADP